MNHFIQRLAMVYGVIRIGAGIIGAAVFSIGITVMAMASTFITLFSERPRRRARPVARTGTMLERPVRFPRRNRRNCLPGLRIAMGLHPVYRREAVLDSYYRVCTELALPEGRGMAGAVLGTERVLVKDRAGSGTLRFCRCRVMMVRPPVVRVL